MTTIAGLTGQLIKDSRGGDTIEVSLVLEDGSEVVASVPQGKSTGSHAAVSIAPAKALESLNEISQHLKGRDPGEQEEIDTALKDLDGTPQKERLGANAILAVSLAVARAAASQQHMQLWRYIRSVSGIIGEPSILPRLYMNVINGGMHANGGPAVQEYLVIPQTVSPKKATEIGADIYKRLGEVLKTKGIEFSTGDEGGYVPIVQNDVEPLSLIKSIIDIDIDLGIDAAASNIERSADELRDLYRAMRNTEGLFYCEDPFGEDDFIAFAELNKEWGGSVIVAGDDLTVTNLDRMVLAKNADAINGIIVKPNQIGTLTETLNVVRRAQAWGWVVVVSHRSGETDDSFIADLAVAVGADGIKIGVPVQSERVAKHRRLHNIEHELNN